MLAQPSPAPTPEDYLAWERRQETRHEYIEGEIRAMTEASRAHNVICVNIAASLHAQPRGKSREVYTNDMRVKVSPTGIYIYPDIGQPGNEVSQSPSRSARKPSCGLHDSSFQTQDPA
jgi:Uma2 family endonuclease